MSFHFICCWCSSSAIHESLGMCCCVGRMCWRFDLKVAWLSRDRQALDDVEEEEVVGSSWIERKIFIFISLGRHTHVSYNANACTCQPPINQATLTSCTPEEHMNINWIKLYWANFIWYVNISESSVYAAIANYFGHFCSHISSIIYGGRIQYTHSSWRA